MKRLIWWLLIAGFVYWGATSDTLVNYFNDNEAEIQAKIENFTEGADSLFAKIENFVIENTEGMSDSMVFSRVVFILCCYSMVLSIICFFAFRRAARNRRTSVDLEFNIYYGIAALLLMAFGQESTHWWGVIAIQMCCHIMLYPLFFIPFYGRIQGLVATIYDLLFLGIGGLYVWFYISVDSTFGTMILALAAAFVAVMFYIIDRKEIYCPKCKRYMNSIIVWTRENDDNIHHEDIDKDVATEYRDTYKVDEYGNKTLVNSVATKWRHVKYTELSWTHHVTERHQCPLCHHEWDVNTSERQSKSLEYGKRMYNLFNRK